jgi:hypothetical protein
MPVLSFVLRNNSPNPSWRGQKGFAKKAQSLRSDGRTVNQGDHGCVSTSVENLLQSELERAELATLGSRVSN